MIHRKLLVEGTVDERRRNLLIGSPKCQNFRWDETRFDEGSFGFSSGIVSAIFNYFLVDFSADCQRITGLLRKEILCLSKIVILRFFQEKVRSFDLYQCMHLTIVLLTCLQIHSHLQGQYSRWCSFVSKW